MLNSQHTKENINILYDIKYYSNLEACTALYCYVLHRTYEILPENTQTAFFNVDQNISVKTYRFITDHFPITVD
jgi:hypothetical protein